MGNNLSILVVEDEPLISMMLEDFLDALGYRLANVTDNVADALALVGEGRFDAAILDVHLRDNQPSWPVADALRAAGKPFVLATGGSGPDAPAAYEDAPVLAKPYTMDGVRDALDALLSSDSAA